MDVFDELDAAPATDVFDELAPDKKDVFDELEETPPVVREAEPGSLQAHHLVPAVRKIGGELAVGEQGDTHPDIIERDNIPATDIDQRGFLGPFGFMDRESAAQALLAPTNLEPGRLHSTDLNAAQDEGFFKLPEQKYDLSAASLPRPTDEDFARKMQQEFTRATLARDPDQIAKLAQEEWYQKRGLTPPKTPEQVLEQKVEKAMMTKEEMEALGLPGWMAPIERGVAQTAGGLAQPENVAWVAAGGIPEVGGIIGGAFLGQLATEGTGEFLGGAIDIFKGKTEEGLQRMASGATQLGVVAVPYALRGKPAKPEIVGPPATGEFLKMPKGAEPVKVADEAITKALDSAWEAGAHGNEMPTRAGLEKKAGRAFSDEEWGAIQKNHTSGQEYGLNEIGVMSPAQSISHATKEYSDFLNKVEGGSDAFASILEKQQRGEQLTPQEQALVSHAANWINNRAREIQNFQRERAGISRIEAEPPPLPTKPVPLKPVPGMPELPTEPVPPKPVEAKPAPSELPVPVDEMARRGANIGATHTGRQMGKDTFRFTDPTIEPGNPNQITFVVPEGADARTIADARKLALVRSRVADGIPEENLRISVSPDQFDEVSRRVIPGTGMVQVDEINHPIAGNVFSASPELMNRAGLEMPSAAELMKLPRGQYTLPQAKAKLAELSKPPAPSSRTTQSDIAERWILDQIPKAKKAPLGGSSPDAALKVVSEWIQNGETPEGPIPKDTMDALMRSLGPTRDLETGEMLLPGDEFWPRTGTLLNFLESKNLDRIVEPPAPDAPRPKTGRKEQVVTRPENWDVFYEDLIDGLAAFSPARSTGRIDYELEDVAQRFVDFAKGDTSGKPLSKIVNDFADRDVESSTSQIRKIKSVVKELEKTLPVSAPKPVEPSPTPETTPQRFNLRLEPDRTDAVIESDKGNLVVRAPTGMDAKGNHVVDSLTVFVERGILENTFGGTPVQHVKLSRKFTGKTAQEARNKAYKAFTDQINKEGFGPQAKPPVAQLPAPVEQSELVGAGAALAGEQAPGAQIEQLTQALQNVRESRAPLAEQVKEAFSIGDRLSVAKDTLGRAISGLKATGDLIIKKWQGVPNIDDLLRAKKSLSKAIESRGWRLQQWEKAAYRAVPNPRDQASISKWVDAGGDRAELQRGLAEAPAKYKRSYQDALNLSGDKLTAAQNVQNYFESRLQEAIDAGVLDHGIENYLHRIYENKPALLKRALAYTQTGLLNKNPALAKKRFFQFDWEAEKAGFTPVQSFIKRITAYEASLSKAIAAREFIKSASEMKAADGRPIVDIKGVGIPVEDAAGVREGTLIKPKFNPTKNNEPTLPNGDPNPNYRGDYINRDYRALSRWKWAGTDAGGKPIFVQGDVAIHPDYVGRVDALLKPSQVRFGKFGAVLRPALGVSSTIKQTMLDLSGFHPVQITVHGLEHRVMPWKIIQDIDLSHPDVDGLLQGGVTLGGDYSGIHREGLVGASLTRKVPWLGPVMESYHQWLFQSYIPRIKMTMALHALERNRARYAGRLTDEQIFHKTAGEANAAFGELNYTVLERSKTAQDMARLILLAPDFLEARGRFAAQAFQRGGKMFGNEQRTALLLGALTMWVTARIANKMVDDQYHFEPENMFNIVKDGHAYGLRTVQGDILHLLTKPMQFTMSRLNPVYARTILEALTGRDYFGRKRSPAEQVWDAASTTIPISLRSNRERTIWESLANAFGVTARRYSDVDDAFKLAQKWKDTHAVPERGEFIYDPNKDVLRPLKLALNHGDEDVAAVEIKKLIDSKVYNIKKLDEYFKRFASMPFTGSKANDKKFVTSLTEDQRKTVEAARQHKNEILKLYMKSRSQYLAPASTL